MSRINTRLGLVLFGGCSALVALSVGMSESKFSALAQEADRPAAASLSDVPQLEPTARVLASDSQSRTIATTPGGEHAPSRIAMALRKRPGEHPLAPVLRWARAELAEVQQIKDYSAILARRELINGKLRERERILVKVRHEPFSVYLRFLAPADVRGQECIYIAGQNHGKLLAHGTGLKGTVFGTVELKTTNPIAQACGHPVTDVGIQRLVEQLIEVGERELQYDDCVVRLVPNQLIKGQKCTCLEVVHQRQQNHFAFHVARIYIDQETNLPVRYESDGWPETPDGPKPRLDDYTYERLTTNVGLTDDDFSTSNQDYGFSKRRTSE